MIRLGTPLMTGQQGILFTILTCKTFNRRCTQIHVLFQRVKTERGMCRACCEGIQTPNALVPLTNANSFHLHSHMQHPQTHTCFRVRGQVISPTRWSSWPSTSRRPRGDSSSECGYGTAVIKFAQIIYLSLSLPNGKQL